MPKQKQEEKIDAKKFHCHTNGCPNMADNFIWIMFRPSLCDKPFCKKCIKKIMKECGL
jgi:hypothetical protein